MYLVTELRHTTPAVMGPSSHPSSPLLSRLPSCFFLFSFLFLFFILFLFSSIFLLLFRLFFLSFFSFYFFCCLFLFFLLYFLLFFLLSFLSIMLFSLYFPFHLSDFQLRICPSGTRFQFHSVMPEDCLFQANHTPSTWQGYCQYDEY